MAKRWNFPLKVAFGYAFLVATLGMAVLLICRYARSAIQLSDVERSVAPRWEAVNMLVHGIFEVEDMERAVVMGQPAAIDDYDKTIDRAQACADSLATLLADSTQRARVDTLRMLLERKRENTRRLAEALASDRGEGLYARKAEQLLDGQDSLMLHHNVGHTVKEKQVTYVVEKTRPTFFGRLADAFHRQKSDTTAMVVDTLATANDSTRRSINVAGTVAGVLTDIGQREEKQRRSRHKRIAESAKTLQATGIELTGRTEDIIQSISKAELLWMRQAGSDDAARRRSTVIKISALAGAAVVLAAVLLALVWRDSRRAERYRKTLEEARLRAENLLEQRERLLLTITHDIKSPVSAISGFTELLRPHVDGARARAFLDNIRSSAIHLLRLVGELLDYHRLEQGRMEIHEVSFSPARLLADCVESFRPRAMEKGLILTGEYRPETEPMRRADAFRIRQIAENLIGNALKYTRHGSVKVTADVAENCLTIAVADTGSGMTADESRRVFKAFTRLPGAQGIEGVGLGLSITQELVTLLGGSISLETAPGRGSTFTVSLPVGEVSHTERTARPTELSILAIDDDNLQLQLLTATLHKLSEGRWNVTTCTRVDELLGHLNGGHFDILLTDIEMPAMNGFEIARMLRGRDVPVVAMTAHDSIGAADFQSAGFAAMVHKPFAADELSEVISRVATGRNKTAPASTIGPDSRPLASRFDALTAFAEGDVEAARAILSQFHGQTSADIKAMREAAAAGDMKTVGEIAHRAIPVFTMIQSPAAPLLRRLADDRGAATMSQALGDTCDKALIAMEKAVTEAETELQGTGQ